MIDIQFNKTCLIALNKELVIREGALPILKNKEAALRAETQKIRRRVKGLEDEVDQLLHKLAPMMRMWSEFPDMIKVREIRFTEKKVASVSVSVFEEVIFEEIPFSMFGAPAWFLKGVGIIKDMIILKARHMSEIRLLEQIEYARRKTTQKVNLYEKVQIPFFEEAKRKIKRYLEDEENLSKSSQKILKQRMAAV